MSEIIEQKNAKVFKYFLDLPLKARMELIDSMQPDDRCRLTRCSKQCNKEAKASKNFMFGLTLDYQRLHGNSMDQITITVKHHKSTSKTGPREMGYQLNIIDYWGEKHMTYVSINSRREETWKIELDNSINSAELAIGIFKDQLQDHQKSIKHLAISGEKLGKNLDFGIGIENFENLKDVSLNGSVDVSKIFSKLTSPLTKLNYTERKINNCLAKYEEIYQVTDHLSASNVQVNNKQFQKLTASRIIIHIGELTPIDIFQFIKSWQRGKIRDNFKDCCWNLYNSKFDVQELFSMFGMEVEDDEKKHFSIEIVHDNDPLITANLRKQGQNAWEELMFFVKWPMPYPC